MTGGGAGCPPSLILQTQHLKTSRNLFPGGQPSFSSDPTPCQNMQQQRNRDGSGNVLGEDSQLASLGPSFLPPLSFNSHHSFYSFISHFMATECNLYWKAYTFKIRASCCAVYCPPPPIFGAPFCAFPHFFWKTSGTCYRI